ncbi:class I SAM-dependent methyltransferase [Elusimicrobiota bacterium]
MLGVSIEDVKIGLRNPLAAARYLYRLSQKNRLLSTLTRVDTEKIEAYYSEIEKFDFYDEVRSRFESVNFPMHAGMLSPLQAPALYVICRALRPQVVLETGVASGSSTTFILKALEVNKEGVLYSIDLPNQPGAVLPENKTTGWLIPESLKPRWNLHLGDAKALLPELLNKLGSVDMFFHDSDHSYEHMMWEFKTAWPHIKPGGLFFCDDILASAAFDEFAGAVKRKAIRLSSTGGFRK